MYRFCERWLFLGLISQLLSINISAQKNDSAIFHAKLSNIFNISSGIYHGFIFAHSPLVENTKGANPTGIEINFGWQRNDATTWDLCNCFPRKGLLIAYYNYDTKILGKGISAAYFLEPNYKLGKKSFFSVKGAAGLGYLTNPFDSIRNPTNQSYSAAVNGYLLIGVGLWFKLSDHWWLNGSVNYQHVSNAGLSQPNKGINWPTAGIAIGYQKNPRPYYSGIRSKEKSWKGKPLRWDMSVFGIAKKSFDEHGNRKRLPLFGFSLQGSKQVGRINMLTVSTEIFHDESLRMQLERDTIEASAIRAGMAFGHEFLLGKFLFSQRLGVYLFDQTPYYDRIFHRWGIHYLINRHFGIGFNLLAHRHVADFIDIRFSYSL
ncbi:MAG TPA: acyloxyacyl hydrolase [Chitinophagaceae bacterium]|nr:acyloxyacyl hydrolase [Chitinophagaceae bacterium]